jgi:hypothetical protein
MFSEFSNKEFETLETIEKLAQEKRLAATPIFIPEEMRVAPKPGSIPPWKLADNKK